jgi:pyridoxamine 5'-phosphate oxidase
MNAEPRVEAVYWTASTQEQFRIIGRASIVPTPNYQAPYPSPSGRVFDELAKEVFDWEKKRVEVFDSMSGHMKATWCRPVPGTPLKGGDEEMKKWPEKLPKLGEAESEEDKKNLAFALENFALLLVEPFEVDLLELGVQPNKRTNFKRDWEDPNAIEFKETALVP